MSWAEQLARLFVNAFGAATALSRKYLLQILVITVGVAIIALGVTFYRYVVNEEFLLLTGPGGGSGERYGQIIGQKFIENNRQRNLFGWGPSVSQKTTQGFEDNRAQVAADASRRMFAFAHDGFGDASNIRVLLPIESNYLFILGKTDLLDDCPFKVLNAPTPEALPNSPPEDKAGTPDDNHAEGGTDSDRASPASSVLVSKPNQDVTSSADQAIPAASAGESQSEGQAANTPEVIKLWNKYKKRFQMVFAAAKLDENQTLTRTPKICLGPRKSGTWQVAQEVLQHFDLQTRDYERVDVDSWTQMKNAFSRGELDIAFVIGPLDSEVIQDMVRSGNAFLVQLGIQDCDSISKINPQIGYMAFKSANLIPQPLVEWCDELNTAITQACTTSPPVNPSGVYFEEQETYLLTTTRVLICSKLMSNADAYKLASRVRFALSEEIPQFRWQEPLDENTWRENQQLSYALHPGAALLRDNETPNPFWTFVGRYWLVLFPLALALCAQLAAAANKRWFEQMEESSPGDCYAELHAKIVDLEGKLDAAPFSLSHTKYANFRSESRKLREEVAAARSNEHITKIEYDKLKGGLRNLAIELSEFHSQQSKRRIAKTKKSKLS